MAQTRPKPDRSGLCKLLSVKDMPGRPPLKPDQASLYRGQRYEKVQSPKSKVQGPKSRIQSRGGIQGSDLESFVRYRAPARSERKWDVGERVLTHSDSPQR